MGRNGPKVRRASVSRKTTETDITVTLDLDGTSKGTIATGIGFFDHMLSHVSRHGLLNLDIKAGGDLHVDFHHTVEDVGLCLGDAFRKALGEKAGIRRYGFAEVPMDEALASVSLDLSGRAFLVYTNPLGSRSAGEFSLDLVPVFLQALADPRALRFTPRSIVRITRITRPKPYSKHWEGLCGKPWNWIRGRRTFRQPREFWSNITVAGIIVRFTEALSIIPAKTGNPVRARRAVPANSLIRRPWAALPMQSEIFACAGMTEETAPLLNLPRRSYQRQAGIILGNHYMRSSL